MSLTIQQRLVLLIVLLLCLTASSGVVPFSAQETTDRSPQQRVRTVGIIAGRDLRSSSSSNVGDDGITRLRDLFRSFGASVSEIPPNQEIPSDIELVVIIRPQRVFTIAQTAYLWSFMQRGGHLLFALDPIGHNRGRTEGARSSGINRLLQAEYGLSFVDNVLVEDWSDLQSLRDVLTSWSEAQAENLAPHPITQPLRQYGLPVRYWGARSLLVDALTGNAESGALLYTEHPYGETARIDYEEGDASQFAFNIGPDSQGRLLLGGVATHFDTGSRVAIVGDSEIFQNRYGQTRILGREDLPLYVGNYILGQRLLAWLLAVPDTEYPALPQGFTWIALDGDGADWPADVPALMNEQSTGPQGALQQVRAFQNDQFVYLLLDPRSPLQQNTAVYVFIEGKAGSRQMISLSAGEATYVGETVVPDAAIAVGDDIEIRLPRRLFATADSVLAQLCIASAVDCVDGPLRPSARNDRDPVPVRFGPGPQAFTLANRVNLRTEPTTASPVVVTLPLRTLFAVKGRNNTSDWIFVQNGRYEGWISRPLLAVNAEIARLPSIEGASDERE